MQTKEQEEVNFESGMMLNRVEQRWSPKETARKRKGLPRIKPCVTPPLGTVGQVKEERPEMCYGITVNTDFALNSRFLKQSSRQHREEWALHTPWSLILGVPMETKGPAAHTPDTNGTVK